MKWSFNASWHADMKTAPHSSERLGTEGHNDTLCAFSMVGVLSPLWQKFFSLPHWLHGVMIRGILIDTHRPFSIRILNC